jgi:hypothetical protein
MLDPDVSASQFSAAAPDAIPAIDNRRAQLANLRKLVWRAAQAVAILVLLLMAAAGVVYYSAQQLPDFYETALAVTPDLEQQAGDQFETEVLELQNTARETGHWQASFSEEEINGWLASDLPEKFPNVFPRSVSKPRVRISSDEIKLAFQVMSRRLKGVVVVTADLFCTTEGNQVAIRIKSAKTGIIPLPLGPWLDEFARSLRAAGIAIQWTENEGETVAVISLPPKLMRLDNQFIVLQTIQMQPEKVTVAGTTDEILSSIENPDQASIGEAGGNWSLDDLFEKATLNR